MSFFIDNWVLIAVAFASGAMLVFPAVRAGGRAGSLNTTDAVLLMNREKAVVVDVSETTEFAAGHIGGAKNLPLGQLEAQLAQARAALPDVDTMVKMREELRQLWLNTNQNRAQLALDLQAWCPSSP